MPAPLHFSPLFSYIYINTDLDGNANCCSLLPPLFLSFRLPSRCCLCNLHIGWEERGGGDSAAEGYFDIGYSLCSLLCSHSSGVTVFATHGASLTKTNCAVGWCTAAAAVPYTTTNQILSPSLSPAFSLSSLSPFLPSTNADKAQIMSPRGIDRSWGEREGKGKGLAFAQDSGQAGGGVAPSPPTPRSAIPRPFIAQNRASQRIHYKHTIWPQGFTLTLCGRRGGERGSRHEIEFAFERRHQSLGMDAFYFGERRYGKIRTMKRHH